jgi:hypothetical protein
VVSDVASLESRLSDVEVALTGSAPLAPTEAEPDATAPAATTAPTGALAITATAEASYAEHDSLASPQEQAAQQRATAVDPVHTAPSAAQELSEPSQQIQVAEEAMSDVADDVAPVTAVPTAVAAVVATAAAVPSPAAASTVHPGTSADVTADVAQMERHRLPRTAAATTAANSTAAAAVKREIEGVPESSGPLLADADLQHIAQQYRAQVYRKYPSSMHSIIVKAASEEVAQQCEQAVHRRLPQLEQQELQRQHQTLLARANPDGSAVCMPLRVPKTLLFRLANRFIIMFKHHGIYLLRPNEGCYGPAEVVGVVAASEERAELGIADGIEQHHNLPAHSLARGTPFPCASTEGMPNVLLEQLQRQQQWEQQQQEQQQQQLQQQQQQQQLSTYGGSSSINSDTSSSVADRATAPLQLRQQQQQQSRAARSVSSSIRSSASTTGRVAAPLPLQQQQQQGPVATARLVQLPPTLLNVVRGKAFKKLQARYSKLSFKVMIPTVKGGLVTVVVSGDAEDAVECSNAVASLVLDKAHTGSSDSLHTEASPVASLQQYVQQWLQQQAQQQQHQQQRMGIAQDVAYDSSDDSVPLHPAQRRAVELAQREQRRAVAKSTVANTSSGSSSAPIQQQQQQPLRGISRQELAYGGSTPELAAAALKRLEQQAELVPNATSTGSGNSRTPSRQQQQQQQQQQQLQQRAPTTPAAIVPMMSVTIVIDIPDNVLQVVQAELEELCRVHAQVQIRLRIVKHAAGNRQLVMVGLRPAAVYCAETVVMLVRRYVHCSLHTCLTVGVPVEAMGGLMGREGAYLKDLSSKHRVDYGIPGKRGNGPTAVRIKGTELQSIAACVVDIERRVATVLAPPAAVVAPAAIVAPAAAPAAHSTAPRRSESTVNGNGNGHSNGRSRNGSNSNGFSNGNRNGYSDSNNSNGISNNLRESSGHANAHNSSNSNGHNGLRNGSASTGGHATAAPHSGYSGAAPHHHQQQQQ